MFIVDSQVHIWREETPDRPWVPGAAILHEEPFGPVAPVAAVAAFDDLDEALEVANSLPYGLAAYGYTDSAATAEKLIAGYEEGIMSINHCGGSVPQAPSGGVKESGCGREGGPEGLEGFLVTKRVPGSPSTGWWKTGT